MEQLSREGTMCLLHVASIETFESITDAFEGMRSENMNHIHWTISCIFKVHGPRKSHAVAVYSILTKCVP